jgi:hypothetical protein
MKLKDFDFGSITRASPLANLAIRMGEGKFYEESTVGKTLQSLPSYFADAEIKETRWFFSTFVIELEDFAEKG